MKSATVDRPGFFITRVTPPTSRRHLKEHSAIVGSLVSHIVLCNYLKPEHDMLLTVYASMLRTANLLSFAGNDIWLVQATSIADPVRAGCGPGGPPVRETGGVRSAVNVGEGG